MTFNKETIHNILQENAYDLNLYDQEAKSPQPCAQAILSSGIFKHDGAILSDMQIGVSRLKDLGLSSADNGLNFSLGAHYLAGLLTLEKFSENAILKQKIFSENSLIANAITESQSGSDAFNLNTMAVKTNHGYRISGTKSFVSNVLEAEYIILYATTDKDKGAIGGVSAFLLNKNQFEITHVHNKMGLRTCSSGEITLDNVLVDHNQLIGKSGSGLMLFSEAMIWERIGLSAIHTGSMERLLANVIQYTKKRMSGGGPIKNHQSVAHQLVDLKLIADSCDAMVTKAISELNNRQKINTNSSLCKLFVSEQYVLFCTKLLALYGGNAYLKGHEAERSLRDAQAALIYSGTNNIQKNIVAKWIGL